MVRDKPGISVTEDRGVGGRLERFIFDVQRAKTIHVDMDGRVILDHFQFRPNLLQLQVAGCLKLLDDTMTIHFWWIVGSAYSLIKGKEWGSC